MEKRTTSDGHMNVSRPEFGVSEKDLPAIKDWKVGEKYTMTLNVEMVSSSKGSDYDAPMNHNEKLKEIHKARFKILSVDALPSKNVKVKKY